MLHVERQELQNKERKNNNNIKRNKKIGTIYRTE